MFSQSNLLIALFDSGAIHSSISIDYVKKLNLFLFSLPYDLLVSTSTRGKVSISQVYLNYPILVKEKSFVIDLVCLPLTGIDIIVRVNWLSGNDSC